MIKEFMSVPGNEGIEKRLREDIEHEEFLFFRSAADEDDWLINTPEGYEMFCTACETRFFEEKRRKTPASSYTNCPRCGAKITPRRWKDRGCLRNIKFAFHTLERAADGSGDVWARAFRVRLNRKPEKEGKYELYEYARILYSEKGCARWTRRRGSGWQRRTIIKLTGWRDNIYASDFENFYAGNIAEETAGSCLKYSMAEEAFKRLSDPLNYLGLYMKYPACEYIWKLGLGRFFRERETGRGSEFHRVINLKAKTPDRLLRGLGKREIKLLREDGSISLEDVLLYRELKKAGAGAPDRESFQYAQGLRASGTDIKALAEMAGTDIKTLRRYHERQARRSGHYITHVIIDHKDYLRELKEVGAENGDTMPDNLLTAHERLSARVRRFKNAKYNPLFRARRRLLRPFRFAENGMFIRPVDSAQEITREGEMQRNCVAMYARNHAEGNTAIFLLRRKAAPMESWHTVELDPKTLKVRQCRGYRNAPPSPEAREFIEHWTEKITHGKENAK